MKELGPEEPAEDQVPIVDMEHVSPWSRTIWLKKAWAIDVSCWGR